MSGTCKLCIFTEVCDANNVKQCDNYYPTDEYGDVLDDMIDYQIKEKRNNYYQEWFSYIGEFNDDLFF